MLVIRLARTGKKHQSYFRIVVADKRKAVGAKFIEILGNYNPHAKALSIDKEKLDTYLKNGAQPSNTVAKLLKQEKIELPGWVKITEKNKAPKKEVEPKKEEKSEPAPAEAPEAETTEEVKEVSEEPAAETPAEVPAEEVKPEEPAEEKPTE